MKKIILLFALFFISLGNLVAQDAKYKATLKKMFVVSGTEQTYKMAIKEMMSMFKEQKSNVPSKFWDDLEAEFIKTSLGELADMLAPAYFKHLTLADLEAMIVFFESPAGKKYAEKTPLIMQESMAIGQEWGKQIGEKVAKKLEEQGY